MKKLALAIVCLISTAFFASCTKTIEHPEPSIAVMSGEGYLLQNDTTLTELECTFGFVCASNTQTNKALKNFQLLVNGEKVADTTISGTTYSQAFTWIPEEAGTYTITGKITDEDNQTKSADIKLVVMAPEFTPINTADYTWVRKGGTVETQAEMAAVGLKWYDNHKDVFATWKPLDGYTLYKIEDWTWEEIEYSEQLLAIGIELTETAPIAEFREISAEATSDYDVILCTVNGTSGEMNLIHVTHAKIDTGIFGTRITVDGQIKNAK